MSDGFTGDFPTPRRFINAVAEEMWSVGRHDREFVLDEALGELRELILLREAWIRRKRRDLE